MKKKVKKGCIIAGVILVVAIVVVFAVNPMGKNMIYTEVTAETRDIMTYLEFSGNIEASDVSQIYAKTNARVKEVLVEEGEKVKKGDVIAVLDSDEIEYSIQVKESVLALNQLSNQYNIKDTKTNLNNINEQIDSGLNANVNAAQSSLLAAQEQYYKAVDTYNRAKSDYDNEKTSSIVQAKQTLNSAKAQYEQSQYSMTHDRSGESLDAISEDYVSQSLASSQAQISNAQTNLTLAKENAKKQVDDYYDAMVAAEESFADAQKNYNTVLLSVDQNVNSAENALEKVVALASTESSELELEHLRDSLSDYVIIADMDGYITSLDVKEGIYTSAAMPVCEISNLEKMEVSVNIDEYDVTQVKIGEPVEIYINALEKNYEGRITNISKKAIVNNSVAYLNATVQFDTDEEIDSGLSAEIKLIKQDEKNVLSLPVGAISYNDDNTAYVLVKGADGKEKKTSVVIGASDGSFVQIKEGITQGTVVLMAPSMNDYYEMMMAGPGNE